MQFSFRAHAYLFFQTLLLISILPPPARASHLGNSLLADVHGNAAPFFVSGGDLDAGVVPLRRSVAEVAATAPSADAPLDNNGTFVLAAERTRRQDPLDGYKYYAGGWNLKEKHYWASVGFTAAPFFIIAAVWFLGFALVLFLICCCYCCCPRRSYSYSRIAYGLSLAFLVLFTISAIIGSVLLYNGQGRFHNSTSRTLGYVVFKANDTVENLRDFSDNLAAAKAVHVRQFSLPDSMQSEINRLETLVNTSANSLEVKSTENSRDIQKLLDKVRLALIIIAAVMLLLAFLGFLFSILGMQPLVYILVIIGWVLVAGTFVLSGVFFLLHNVVLDTCVAMDEWVQHPHANTSLDEIIPCVDVATAQESLNQSKQITYQLVNGINQVIANIANRDFPPALTSVYYNQSGPLAPILCNPFSSNMSSRTCGSGEVNFDNASQVWRSYVCTASGPPGSETCNSVGRFTPDLYNQITTATNASFSLYHYGPFLVHLADCSFVRETFTTITHRDCPSLDRNSKSVYIGLVTVSAAVMLSLILWVIYARERRHRRYNKNFHAH